MVRALIVSVVLWDWSEEMNENGMTYSCFGFHTCLNAINSFPELIVGSSSELINKLSVSHHLYCSCLETTFILI